VFQYDGGLFPSGGGRRRDSFNGSLDQITADSVTGFSGWIQRFNSKGARSLSKFHEGNVSAKSSSKILVFEVGAGRKGCKRHEAGTRTLPLVRHGSVMTPQGIRLLRRRRIPHGYHWPRNRLAVWHSTLVIRVRGRDTFNLTR